MFTLSTLVGLSVAQLTQGTIVANLGFGQVAFPAPVRVGDTLYAETVVVGTRLVVPTGAGHRGVRAHDAQPARRGRGHRNAHHPHAVPARRGDGA
jgi:acyl dehydratase